MNFQEPHTYIGQIADGLICYITVKPQDLREGGTSAVMFEWQGKPSTPAHFQKYLRFKREVFQDISNRSGKRIMDISIIPNGQIVSHVYVPHQNAPDGQD